MHRPRATRAAKPASFKAATMSKPAAAAAVAFAAGAAVRAGALIVLSLDLLDFRPPEDAGRHEDQHDGENREGRDVLVLDREVSRPEDLDQADDEPAEHRAGKGADAAEHR